MNLWQILVYISIFLSKKFHEYLLLLTQCNYIIIFFPPLLVSQIKNPNYLPWTMLFYLFPQIITSKSIAILF